MENEYSSTVLATSESPVAKSNNEDYIESLLAVHVRIKYHTELYPGLKECDQFGNFIDLRAAKTYEYKAGDFMLVDLGISTKIPKGYWGQLVPRSSLFMKHGVILTNSFGVIDTVYSGNKDIWRAPLLAIRDGKIEFNERICQFRVVRDIPTKLVKVDHMEDEDRGGFGSTGKD